MSNGNGQDGQIRFNLWQVIQLCTVVVGITLSWSSIRNAQETIRIEMNNRFANIETRVASLEHQGEHLRRR